MLRRWALNGDGISRTRRNAGATSGTGFGIDLRRGPATGHQPEADRTLIAMVFAAAAGHALQRQAVVTDGGAVRPRLRRQNGRRLARLGAFTAKGASTGVYVDHRKTVFVSCDDRLRAVGGTIAASRAGLDKRRKLQRPGWAQHFGLIETPP